MSGDESGTGATGAVHEADIFFLQPFCQPMQEVPTTSRLQQGQHHMEYNDLESHAVPGHTGIYYIPDFLTVSMMISAKLASKLTSTM